MNIEEYSKQIENEVLNLSAIIQDLIDKYKNDKYSLDIVQCRFLLDYVLNELDKKDKIINEMAEQLAGLTIWNNKKEEPLILMDKQEVIDYFTKKVEGK